MGYISKNQYANMKLVPALIYGAVAVSLYLVYDSSTGFSAFFAGVLCLPIAIICAILAVINIKKYMEINQVPDGQWDEYINKERILLSLATYRHPQTGDVQTVRRGFSIPVFLFGGFVPLVKGQFALAFKFFVVVFAIDALGSILPVIGNVIAHFLTSYGIARRYNKYYEDYLIEEGYILEDAHSGFHDVRKAKETVHKAIENI